jgi:hypothetical protein
LIVSTTSRFNTFLPSYCVIKTPPIFNPLFNRL